MKRKGRIREAKDVERVILFSVELLELRGGQVNGRKMEFANEIAIP